MASGAEGFVVENMMLHFYAGLGTSPLDLNIKFSSFLPVYRLVGRSVDCCFLQVIHEYAVIDKFKTLN